MNENAIYKHNNSHKNKTLSSKYKSMIMFKRLKQTTGMRIAVAKSYAGDSKFVEEVLSKLVLAHLITGALMFV